MPEQIIVRIDVSRTGLGVHIRASEAGSVPIAAGPVSRLVASEATAGYEATAAVAGAVLPIVVNSA